MDDRSLTRRAALGAIAGLTGLVMAGRAGATIRGGLPDSAAATARSGTVAGLRRTSASSLKLLGEAPARDGVLPCQRRLVFEISAEAVDAAGRAVRVVATAVAVTGLPGPGKSLTAFAPDPAGVGWIAGQATQCDVPGGGVRFDPDAPGGQPWLFADRASVAYPVGIIGSSGELELFGPWPA